MLSLIYWLSEVVISLEFENSQWLLHFLLTLLLSQGLQVVLKKQRLSYSLNSIQNYLMKIFSYLWLFQFYSWKENNFSAQTFTFLQTLNYFQFRLSKCPPFLLHSFCNSTIKWEWENLFLLQLFSSYNECLLCIHWSPSNEIFFYTCSDLQNYQALFLFQAKVAYS